MIELISAKSIPNSQIYKIAFGSMEHKQTFDIWWSEQSEQYLRYGITHDDFMNFPFKDGINKNDYLVVQKKTYKDISVGDIVMVNFPDQRPWIVRVIDKKSENSEQFITTKGDGNAFSTPEEIDIPAEFVEGKVVKRLFY